MFAQNHVIEPKQQVLIGLHPKTCCDFDEMLLRISSHSSS
jgi:hypothetical protein